MTIDITPPLGISWGRVIISLRKAGFSIPAYDQATARIVFDLVDQIEAQQPKPKPEEPSGFGAVIKDADGEEWVYQGDRAPRSVSWRNRYGRRCGYRDLSAVTVVSTGAPQ